MKPMILFAAALGLVISSAAMATDSQPIAAPQPPKPPVSKAVSGMLPMPMPAQEEKATTETASTEATDKTKSNVQPVATGPASPSVEKPAAPHSPAAPKAPAKH